MKIIIISFFFYLTLINNSFAYLDPGSGGLIQMLIAFAAAGAAGVTVAWSKVKFFFNKLFRKKNIRK